MKRKYGIGFLIGLILLTLAIVCAYQFSYDRALRNSKQENVVLTEAPAKKEEGYLIKEKDGFVIVYLSDGKTVYEYTSIEVDFLPGDVKKEVKAGKTVKTIGQVYGFLENYSS